MIKVLVADDHDEFRKALRALLAGEPNIEVIAEVANGETAVRHVGELEPDVVVMDIVMRNGNGIEATRQITTAWPQCRVIGISISTDQPLIEAMIAAGAERFVSKSNIPDELADAIRNSQ